MATGPGSTVISGRKSLAERRSPCRRVTQIAGAFMLLYRVCWCTGECLFDVWLGMFNASYGMWEDSRMTSVVFALGLWRADLSTWRHLQQFDSMFRQGKIEKPVHPLACSCVSVWFGQSGVKLQNHGNPNYFAKPPLDNGLFTTSFRNIIRSHKPLHPRKLTWNLKMSPWKRRFL